MQGILMSEVILCVTEGEGVEYKILSNLERLFITNQKSVQIVPVCLNIYNFFQILTNDEDFGSEFLDTFEVIKEVCKKQTQSMNAQFLQLPRSKVDQIYMFFDYDGHDTLAPKYPNCISDMLKLFNDETGNGKLYISYPMVESYKHPISSIETYPIFPPPHYKTFVGQTCDKHLNQISKITKEQWLDIFYNHIMVSNFLIFDDFAFPNDYSVVGSLNQLDLYLNQESKFIIPQSKVAVLNSFTLYLLEYLGIALFEELKQV